MTPWVGRPVNAVDLSRRLSASHQQLRAQQQGHQDQENDDTVVGRRTRIACRTCARRWSRDDLSRRQERDQSKGDLIGVRASRHRFRQRRKLSGDVRRTHAMRSVIGRSARHRRD